MGITPTTGTQDSALSRDLTDRSDSGTNRAYENGPAEGRFLPLVFESKVDCRPYPAAGCWAGAVNRSLTDPADTRIGMTPAVARCVRRFAGRIGMRGVLVRLTLDAAGVGGPTHGADRVWWRGLRR